MTQSLKRFDVCALSANPIYNSFQCSCVYVCVSVCRFALKTAREAQRDVFKMSGKKTKTKTNGQKWAVVLEIHCLKRVRVGLTSRRFHSESQKYLNLSLMFLYRLCLLKATDYWTTKEQRMIVNFSFFFFPRCSKTRRPLGRCYA